MMLPAYLPVVLPSTPAMGDGLRGDVLGRPRPENTPRMSLEIVRGGLSVLLFFVLFLCVRQW